MSGSCPVSAHVCQETARERDELSQLKQRVEALAEKWHERWLREDNKTGERSALISGIADDLGRLLEPEHTAIHRTEAGYPGRDAGPRIVSLLRRVERLTRERDEARAEVERLRAGIEALAD